MNITITNQTIDPEGTGCIEASCGNKSAYVSTYKSGKWVTVCCKNAAHSIWRGAGRTFPSFDEAVAAYKSPEMKAIIEAAREIIGPKPTNIVPFQAA